MNKKFNDIIEPYFFGEFGTFNLYQDNSDVLHDRNCTQMSIDIKNQLENSGYDAYFCSMFCGSKKNGNIEEGIDPNHLMVICNHQNKKYLFDPTLFLDTAVILPSDIGSVEFYQVPFITGASRSNTKYVYEKIANHKYKWQKFIDSELVKEDIFTDRPLNLWQIEKVKGIQKQKRTDLKLGKVIPYEEGYGYVKLKFDPNAKTWTFNNCGNTKTVDTIDQFSTELANIFQLTNEQIDALQKASETFIKSIDTMKKLDEQLHSFETQEMIGGLDTNYSYIQGSDKMYVYLHGLFGDKDSSKGKQIAGKSHELGQSSVRFSFRGNGNSVSENFGFENMDLESMAQDTKQIFDAMREKGVKSFVPVASSLGASAILYFLKKFPVYIKYVKSIIFLAPSVEFAKNRQRQRVEQGDNVTGNKRKSQGYLKNYHFSNQSTEKLSYGLFEQSLQANLSLYLQELTMPITIIAGRKDDVIRYLDIEDIAAAQENITLIVVHDGHRLQESTNVFLTSLLL